MSQAITAWSFSRYDTWRTCPMQFREKFITKTIKEHQTPAMARGDAVHKVAARYLTGKADDMPDAKAMDRFKGQFVQLRELPDKVVENQWAFTNSWKPTGYFAKGPRDAAWLRVILDAGVVYPDNTGDVIDHKTGKKYGSNSDQMELFAVAGFSFWPWLTQITTRLWYLDEGSEDIAEFSAKDAPLLRAKWEEAVEPMFKDETFAPRPNDKCRFCPLAKSNHNGDRSLPVCRFG